MPFNLRENLPLKLFSLLLAVLCWVVVRGEVEHVKDFVVPLDYIDLPGDLALSGTIVDTVDVRLRATEQLLKRITDDGMTAPIDLSNAPPGDQQIQLNESLFNLPGGAQVVRITPALIMLTVEKRVTREIPVVAAFAGNPAPGYRKVGQSISPPVVTVSGPASEVAKVRRALTGTIVLEGETKNVEVEVRPIPDAPAGSRVRVESPNDPVIVRVTIEPPPAEMLGPAIPESDRQDGDGTTP